jgi:hypothetical protein
MLEDKYIPVFNPIKTEIHLNNIKKSVLTSQTCVFDTKTNINAVYGNNHCFLE